VSAVSEFGSFVSSRNARIHTKILQAIFHTFFLLSLLQSHLLYDWRMLFGQMDIPNGI
jgi:hypothetical protein